MRIDPQSCTSSCTTSVVAMFLPANDGVAITNAVFTMTVVATVAVHFIFELIRLRKKFECLSLCLRNRVSACVSMEGLVMVSASFVMEATGSEIFATGFVAGGGAALGGYSVYRLVDSLFFF